MRYHIMGVLYGKRKPHRVCSVDSQEHADIHVHNLLASDVYDRAWYETEDATRSDAENETQQEIERERAE